MSNRRTHSPEFKARVAMEAISGRKTIQEEEWQLERRRFFSEATMAKIPEPEEALELSDGEGADEEAGTLS